MVLLYFIQKIPQKVPVDLEPGEYVLSFRWDSKCSPQVGISVIHTFDFLKSKESFYLYFSIITQDH